MEASAAENSISDNFLHAKMFSRSRASQNNLSSIERDLERLNMPGLVLGGTVGRPAYASRSNDSSRNAVPLQQSQPQSGGARSTVDAINADLARLQSGGDPLQLLDNNEGSLPETVAALRNDVVRAHRERSQSPAAEAASAMPTQPASFAPQMAAASMSPSVESALGVSNWGDRSRMALLQAPPMGAPYYASPSSNGAAEVSLPRSAATAADDEALPFPDRYAEVPVQASPGREPPARLVPRSAAGVEPMTRTQLETNLQVPRLLCACD